MKRILCAALACMLSGFAFAAETDWDTLSRRAEDAATAAAAAQAAPASVDNSKAYQNVMNQAAADGRTDVMDWLNRNGAAVDKAGDDGYTPVHAAAQNGQPGALDWLKDRGADMNVRGRGGDTAVHSAAAAGNVDALDWLRRNNVDVNAPNHAGQTAAAAASAKGHSRVLDWLRNQESAFRNHDGGLDSSLSGTSVNTRSGYTDRVGNRGAAAGTDAYRGTAASRDAARYGDVDATRWLREQGIDVNKSSGTSAIHDAARSGNADAIQWLRDHGLGVNTRADDPSRATRYPTGGGQTNPFGRPYDQTDDNSGAFNTSRKNAPDTATEDSTSGAAGWLRSVLGND